MVFSSTNEANLFVDETLMKSNARFKVRSLFMHPHQRHLIYCGDSLGGLHAVDLRKLSAVDATFFEPCDVWQLAMDKKDPSILYSACENGTFCAHELSDPLSLQGLSQHVLYEETLGIHSFDLSSSNRLSISCSDSYALSLSRLSSI